MIVRLMIVLATALCGCLSQDNQSPKTRLTIEALQANPLPTPVYLMSIHQQGLTTFDQSICLTITEEPFWHEGFDPGQFRANVYETLRVEIDGDVLTSDIIQIFDSLGTFTILDDARNIIGTYGGPLEICANTEQLQHGYHYASFAFSDLLGLEYAYSFVFRRD